MNNADENQERDFETATDEESLKIRRLERELKSVSATEDKRLYIWLGAGLFFILLNAMVSSEVTKILVIIAVPIAILGGIGLAIYQNMGKKKDILIKHGLQCTSCGYLPSTLNASGVLVHKTCLQCHSQLSG